MNTETQKLLAQLLLQGKLPQDPLVPEWLSGNAYSGPYRMLEPVGSPNVYPDADEVRGAYQPSPGMLPSLGIPPRDPSVPPLQPNMAYRSPVGGPNMDMDADEVRGGYQPSPGMLPQGPSAPPPMMNPNPMAQPSYRPPVDGSVPPLDPDLMRDALRGTYDDASRFDDARAVRTADAGGMETYLSGDDVGKIKTPAAVETAALSIKHALMALNDGFDDYSRIISEGGPGTMPGAQKDAVAVQRRAIQMQMKELYNLGVLNGPDLALMDEMLFNPSSLGARILDIATGKWEGGNIDNRVERNISQLRDILMDMAAPKLREFGLSVDEIAQMRRPTAGAAKAGDGGIPQIFIDSLPSGEDAKRVWDAMTAEEKALFNG